MIIYRVNCTSETNWEWFAKMNISLHKMYFKGLLNGVSRTGLNTGTVTFLSQPHSLS